jgi:hypothetical protein
MVLHRDGEGFLPSSILHFVAIMPNWFLFITLPETTVSTLFTVLLFYHNPFNNVFSNFVESVPLVPITRANFLRRKNCN